jgi:hypothetical protein
MAWVPTCVIVPWRFAGNTAVAVRGVPQENTDCLTVSRNHAVKALVIKKPEQAGIESVQEPGASENTWQAVRWNRFGLQFTR